MHQHNAFQNDEARIIYLRYALLRHLRGGTQPKDLPREFLLLGIGASILSAKLLQSYQSPSPKYRCKRAITQFFV
jgi:hypothetical protein